jgi:hypothetical protein
MRLFARTWLGRVVAAIVAFTFGLATPFASLPSAFAAVSSPPSQRAVTVLRELTARRGESKREYLLSNGNVRVEYYGQPI